MIPTSQIVLMRSLADTDHESARTLQYSPEHRYITEEGWMNALIMVGDHIAEACTEQNAVWQQAAAEPSTNSGPLVFQANSPLVAFLLPVPAATPAQGASIGGNQTAAEPPPIPVGNRYCVDMTKTSSR
jgi:hypothetical protein